MPSVDENRNYAYVGNELELFAEAIHWKRYYVDLCLPYMRGGKVLEVGAGLGEITKWFCERQFFDVWTCLEPDPEMSQTIAGKIKTGVLPAFCRAQTGFLLDLDTNFRFDTILYVDVLEHIEEDGKELLKASEYLAKGGRLIVVSPAHNWLFAPWDKAIGHFRRYTRKSLLELTPSGLHCIKDIYIDSVGLFASLANRWFLKQSDPKRSQILFWDKVLVRLSRVFDKILFHKFGKNIVAVWEKN